MLSSHGGFLTIAMKHHRETRRGFLITVFFAKVSLRISIGDIAKSLGDVTKCVGGHVKALFLYQDGHMYRKGQRNGNIS